MYKVGINSSDSTCNLITNSRNLYDQILDKKNHSFFNRIIQDFSLSLPIENPDFILEANENKGNAFEMVEKYPLFKINASSLLLHEVMATTEYVFERARQYNGIYSLHSTVVGKGENCVVIHAGSKSGKTVLGLECLCNNGLDLLSNEQSLINLKQNLFCGGYTSIVLEDHHKKMFEELHSMNNLNIDKNKRTYQINSMIIPSIDSGLKDIFIKEVSINDAQWHLYREFATRIRGTSRIMNNFTFPLDSLDTKELGYNRIKDLGKFLNKTPVYFVRGKKEKIARFIASEL